MAKKSEQKEVTKQDLKERLYNERKAYRRNLAMQAELVKAAQKEATDASEQLHKAFHNLASTMARTYGIELVNGDYELHIPVPEGGWITMGKKVGDEYIITAHKIV